MEKLMEKLEAKVNAAIEEFDKSPLKSSVKWFIVAWLLAKMYRFVKEECK